MEEIQTILLKSRGKIAAAYQNYQNNPFDPEQAHRLRVSVRKFRALTHVLKPLISAESYDPINQDLRQTAQLFEAVRELDVLLESCGKVAMEHPNLSENYAQLFNFLQKERRKEMRRTLNKTNTQQIQSTLNEAQALIDQLPEYLVENHPDTQEEWSAYVTKRIQKKDKKMRKAYKKIEATNDEAVHETRLMAKKLHYAAKYLEDLTDIKTKSIVKHAKTIQNQLGEKTDQQVNLTLLEEYAAKAEKPAVQELLVAIRDLS